MNESKKNTGKIIETFYLCSDYSYKYRAIIRIIYNKHENLMGWLSKDEILEELKQKKGFENYTSLQIEEDLKCLEKFGNILTIQDRSKIRTVEEFKKKKLKYSLSQITINLEKSIIETEECDDNEGNLETHFLNEFIQNMINLKDVKKLNDNEIYIVWKEIKRNFAFIKKEYYQYLNKFYIPANENIVKSSEFLIFKDDFIRYLRHFIRGIHSSIEHIKEGFYAFEKHEDNIKHFFDGIVNYEKINLLINTNFDEEKRYMLHYEKYLEMKKYFIGSKNEESICEKLVDRCNEIIKKITRYAIKMLDCENSNIRRKDEYKKLINMFEKCRDINEANKLSSVVFGVMHSKHAVVNADRTTESINSSIFEEPPVIFSVKPSNRYREKSASRTAVEDKSKVKREKISKVIKDREDEKKIIESKIKNNKLIFKELDIITSNERNIFLKWLSCALNNKGNTWCKNEYGRYYKASKNNNKKKILVKCYDGDFIMDDYELIFKEEV